MPSFIYDPLGFNRAVEEVLAFLCLCADTPRVDQARMERASGFIGPYVARKSGSRLHFLGTKGLNSLLWRQHELNQIFYHAIHDGLAKQAEAISSVPRPHVLVVVPNDVSENTTGGAARMWGLCMGLSGYYRITLLTVASSRKHWDRRPILPGVEMLVMPRPASMQSHITLQRGRYGLASAFLSMGDPAIPFALLDHYVEHVASRLSCVLTVGPYLYARVRSRAPRVPIVYDMHDDNLEYLSKMAGAHSEAAAMKMQEIESALMRDAGLICCVSDEDRGVVERRYPNIAGKTTLIPNGVSVADVFYTGPSASMRMASDFGSRTPAVAFIGSVLEANVVAARYIVEKLAPAYPDVQWVIIGAVGDRYVREQGRGSLPVNVCLTGQLSEAKKEAALALCQIAVAPMAAGTGSSLKISDYAAHGKVVLASPVGARGFDILKDFIEIAPLESFDRAFEGVLETLRTDSAKLDRRAKRARETVEREFDWGVLAGRLSRHMEILMHGAEKA